MKESNGPKCKMRRQTVTSWGKKKNVCRVSGLQMLSGKEGKGIVSTSAAWVGPGQGH